MSTNSLSWAAVITTIQEPTAAVRALHERMMTLGGRLVVAGDRKGPAVWDLPECDFLSLADQELSGFALAPRLPVGHYARKNMGYLHAMRAGAQMIYETDDDNAPLDHWQPRSEMLSDVRTMDRQGWINVYGFFTDDAQIWPRGFPLDEVQRDCSGEKSSHISASSLHAPVQQGLVNGSPDVDAIWRLIQDREFSFDERPSLWLGEGQWCPFNTQSTWWWPVAFPLLYVPSYCSFRMCDIWKSFIAQRCLWAMGAGVAFHAPEVVQDRNEHNLMRDFADEVPGYLQNRRIAEILSNVELDSRPESVPVNLLRCYRVLIESEIFPDDEQALVEAWVEDVANITK